MKNEMETKLINFEGGQILNVLLCEAKGKSPQEAFNKAMILDDPHEESMKKIIDELKEKIPNTRFKYKNEDNCFLTILHDNTRLDYDLEYNEKLNNWLTDIIIKYLSEDEINKFTICYDILNEME